MRTRSVRGPRYWYRFVASLSREVPLIGADAPRQQAIEPPRVGQILVEAPGKLAPVNIAAAGSKLAIGVEPDLRRRTPHRPHVVDLEERAAERHAVRALQPAERVVDVPVGRVPILDAGQVSG